jgi:hypothetical protein
VNCPPATVVVGGGAELHDAVGTPGGTADQAAWLQYSRPTDGGGGWTVRVRNDGNTWTVSGTVYAICVQ